MSENSLNNKSKYLKYFDVYMASEYFFEYNYFTGFYGQQKKVLSDAYEKKSF